MDIFFQERAPNGKGKYYMKVTRTFIFNAINISPSISTFRWKKACCGVIIRLIMSKKMALDNLNVLVGVPCEFLTTSFTSPLSTTTSHVPPSPSVISNLMVAVRLDILGSSARLTLSFNKVVKYSVGVIFSGIIGLVFIIILMYRNFKLTCSGKARLATTLLNVAEGVINR